MATLFNWYHYQGASPASNFDPYEVKCHIRAQCSVCVGEGDWTSVHRIQYIYHQQTHYLISHFFQTGSALTLSPMGGLLAELVIAQKRMYVLI